MQVRATHSVELANRLRPILLQLNRCLRREAHAEGITAGQASLLAAIRAHPDIGIRELAACEGVSAPAATRYVDRLEKVGLVTRTRSAEDARRTCIALSSKGVRALRSVRSRRTAWLATRLQQLSAAETAAIEDAIEPLALLLEEQE